MARPLASTSPKRSPEGGTRRATVAGMKLATATLLGIGAAAALFATPALASVGETHGVLPFIEDDYPRALAEAKKSQRPIFLEAWAPW